MVYRFGPLWKKHLLTFDLVTRKTKSVNHPKIAESKIVSNKAKMVSKTQLFDLEDKENFPLSNYHISAWNDYQYELQFIKENLYRFGHFVRIWHKNQIRK